MNICGERVAKIRKERKLTQNDLANKSYISKFIISNIERGMTKTIDIDALNRLSYALLVTSDYLSGTSKDPNTNSNGLIKAFYIGPEWDYNSKIKQLMEQFSNDKRMESLLKDIVYYFSQQKGQNTDYIRGFKLLQIVVDILKDDNFTNLDLLTKIAEKFKEN